MAAGASAGGVEALRSLVSGLPPDLHAAVLVVLHIPAASHSVLPAILSRSGPLPATSARDGETIQHGHIYVAPPGHHLLLVEYRIRLGSGPAEHGLRPAIDPLFRSVARWAGPRGIAVVLSGTGEDGAAGAVVVADRGGLVVVQDPGDARYAEMPRAAIGRTRPDHVVAAAGLGELLGVLTGGPIATREE